MSARDEGKTPPNPNATNARSVAGSGTIPVEGHKTGPRDGKYADTADGSGTPMNTVGNPDGGAGSDKEKVQTGTPVPHPPVSHPPSSDY